MCEIIRRPGLPWESRKCFGLFIYLMQGICFNIYFRFLAYISMNQPQVYICPRPHDPPSHLPPHPTPSHPSRSSWSPGLSYLCHTANFTGYFTHGNYMFPYYSLNSSHSLPPILCPQVCLLCLHICCCPANRFISTIFLDSIHTC